MIGCALMVLFGATDTEVQAQTRIENVSWTAIVVSVCGGAVGVATLLINKKYDSKFVKLESDIGECTEDRLDIRKELDKCKEKHEENEKRFEEGRKRNEDRINRLVEAMIIKHSDTTVNVQTDSPPKA